MDKEQLISTFSKARISIKDKEILSLTIGKRVLDVGCVGQQRSYGPNWLHEKIKGVAKSITGVDIHQKGIDELNSLGYNIIHINQLEQNNKFDVIVMGDVIEHVDNVADFLNFYSNHLEPTGSIIITTPNPFSIRQSIHTFLYGKPSINEEHTTNLDPITMAEVFRRGNFKVVDFCWLKEQKEMKRPRDKVINTIANCFIYLRRYYCQNFCFVLNK